MALASDEKMINTQSSFRDPGQRLRKPLIEYCSNEWRNIPDSPPARTEPDDFLDHLERIMEKCIAVIAAPKIRRLLLFMLFFILFATILWKKVLSPLIVEEKAVWAALNAAANPDGGTFGTNRPPHFPGMIHIKSLDPGLLPQSSKAKSGRKAGKRRLVFVGDIHGCREELEALLRKVDFDPDNDHLIAAGDMGNKGPDTSGVLDLLIRYNASCVRGNHEDRLLLFANDLQSSSLQANANPNRGAEVPDLKYDDEIKSLAASLSAEHLEYLRECPVILNVGHVDAFDSEAVVVHAGLVPGLALENQDPASVMNMRIVDLATRVPSKKHGKKGSVAWFKLWNKFQQLLPAQRKLARLRKGPHISLPSRMTVIYGHNSKGGLQIHKYTKGLDTGCVNGGQLTALVVDAKGGETLVQVPGKDYRQRPAIEVDVDAVLRQGKPGPPLDDPVD